MTDNEIRNGTKEILYQTLLRLAEDYKECSVFFSEIEIRRQMMQVAEMILRG